MERKKLQAALECDQKLLSPSAPPLPPPLPPSRRQWQQQAAQASFRLLLCSIHCRAARPESTVARAACSSGAGITLMREGKA